MNRIRWALSTAAFAIHLAVAGRYDFFRDELYFIACGRHPAFGYADQTPLVPLLAAATQLFGERLWLLRAVAALGAFGAVWFACKCVELFEAGPAGVVLAGVAAATAPMYLGISTTLNTSSFEAAAWAAIAYFIARAVVLGETRAFSGPAWSRASIWRRRRSGSSYSCRCSSRWCSPGRAARSCAVTRSSAPPSPPRWPRPASPGS